MGRSKGVSPDQQRTLDRLSRLPALRGFYLAGGTAIAAHLHHRRSLDLDLFSKLPTQELERPQRAIVAELIGASVVATSDVAVTIRAAAGPIDLVRYPHPLLKRPTAGPGGFPLASLIDLATMKLAAISRRGIRRDFWDLDEIIERGGIPLRTAARAYVKRFAVHESDLYAVMRALTYFDDAEAEAVWPAGLTRAHWAKVRRNFEERAPLLVAMGRGNVR
jgi:hypothetical protein